MENINFYILPSLSALTIKFLILWYSRNRFSQLNKWVIIFFISLFLLNIAELLIFLTPFDATGHSYPILVYYYVCSMGSCAGYIALGFVISKKISPAIEKLIIGAFLVGASMLLVPGLALNGVESIGYSITRVAGPGYWVVQVLIVASLLIGTGLLIKTGFNRRDITSKRKATAFLVGGFPTIFAILFIVLLMQLGYKVNATVVVSFAINILLLTAIFMEYEYGVFRFLSYVPATDESKITQRALKAMLGSTNGNMVEAVNTFEQLLIEEALRQSNGNKTQAAERLGISRTTLRRKLPASSSDER